MSQPAKAQEPSMEEILASIRRIIADDDASKSPSGLADAPPPGARAAITPQSRPVAAAPPMRSAAPASSASPVDPARPDEIDAKLAERSKASERVTDVLDLTEAMAAPGPTRTEGFRTIEGTSDVVFEDHAEERAPEGRGGPVISERPLVSASTTAAVDSAFNTLAHTVLVQNGRTLEDLVREMLRPLLKNWLDDNLPGLVERLVRAEIERVSRGRG
jgi:cell pole-organizing protein PopZ